MKGFARNFRACQVSVIAALLTVSTSPAFAAGGLAKARGFAISIRDELVFWTPIIAVAAGLLLCMAYWLRMVQKDAFVNWLIGLVVAGSVVEIVALFIPSTA